MAITYAPSNGYHYQAAKIFKEYSCGHWAYYPIYTAICDDCPKCSNQFVPGEEQIRRDAGDFGDVLALQPCEASKPVDTCQHDWRDSREKGSSHWCAICGERK